MIMRLPRAVFLLVIYLEATFAFNSHITTGWWSDTRIRTTDLFMTNNEEKKKPLTSADILARARAATGASPEPEPVKLFEDDILEDFTSSLRTLEKRVKNGPGSLAVEEVMEFEAATKRIVDDMNRKLASGATPATASPASVTVTPSPAPAAVTPSSASTLKTSQVMDTSNDEGPTYTGKGGLGLAKGTANTYEIPGMEEMTPQEYQDALQKSVIDRQEQRRVSREGMVGNRAAHSYLDSLGWGGAEKKLSGQDDEHV